MPHRGALTLFEPELNDKPRGPRRALGAVTGGRQSGGSHGQRGGHGKSVTTIVGGAILDLGPVGALGLHVSAQTPRSAAALTVGFRHVTTKHLHEVVACGLSLRRRARADSRTTFAGRRCGISSVPVCRAARPWRWWATERRRSIGATRSLTR